MTREIARRLSANGVTWETVDVEEDVSGVGLPLDLGPGLFQVDSNGVVTISPDDPTGDDLLRIEAPAGYHQSSGDGYMLHAFAGDGTEILNFDTSGAMQIAPSVEDGTSASLTISNDIQTGDGAIVLRSDGLFDRIVVQDDNARAIFTVNGAGAIYTGANAAPADNAIQAGQVVIWFDSTNGAAKLMLKGKTANGTVVTGSVALAP